MLGFSNFIAANSRGMGRLGSQAVPVSKQTQVIGLFSLQNSRNNSHYYHFLTKFVSFKLYLHIFNEAKLKQGLTQAVMIQIWIMTALEYLCFLPYCYLD